VSRIDLVVPDIGNAHDVDVVDVLVKPGDVVEIDSPLVTLETDKASMDVPSMSAGKVAEVLLKRGDKVSAGSIIARVETSAEVADAKVAGDAPQVGASSASNPAVASSGAANTEATFAESFDADELERTVTQPILKTGAVPPVTPGLEYIDSGTKLVTDHPAPGVPSITSEEALKLRGDMCKKAS